MQNSCDVPKPVVGITSGVYSSEAIEAEENLERVLSAISSRQDRMDFFKTFEQGPEKNEHNARLHQTIEAFETALDNKMLIKKCLISENPLAASKLALLSGKVLQVINGSLLYRCL